MPNCQTPWAARPMRYHGSPRRPAPRGCRRSPARPRRWRPAPQSPESTSSSIARAMPAFRWGIRLGKVPRAAGAKARSRSDRWVQAPEPSDTERPPFHGAPRGLVDSGRHRDGPPYQGAVGPTPPVASHAKPVGPVGQPGRAPDGWVRRSARADIPSAGLRFGETHAAPHGGTGVASSKGINLARARYLGPSFGSHAPLRSFTSCVDARRVERAKPPSPCGIRPHSPWAFGSM